MKKNFFRGLFAGILLFFGLIYVISHFAEVDRFLELLKDLDASWIMVAIVLQFGTYFALALVWHQGLGYTGVTYPLLKLVPLAIAKLFADQALPSGGISGIAFIVNALRQRDVAGKSGMSVMLLGILSNYIAYVLVATGSFFLLWRFHGLHRWMVLLAGIFLVVAVTVPVLSLFVNRWGGRPRASSVMNRLPVVSGVADAFSGAPDHLVRKPLLLAEATLFQTAIFILDAATLWAMLHALGSDASLFVAFPCFVVASIVAMLSLIPLGLGSFELTCVALMVTSGIRVETALAATLLLRGFTLWLPMIPGLFLIRRELA
jgi:glycosyltransferase 2 family protein